MNGLQHGEAGVGRLISVGRLLKANETGIVESVETVEDREWWISREADDRLSRVEGPAAGEYRQSPEKRLIGAIEEIVTPGDRSPQRLLPLRAVPATSGEEGEATIETRQDGLRGKESHSRRRQLDG